MHRHALAVAITLAVTIFVAIAAVVIAIYLWLARSPSQVRVGDSGTENPPSAAIPGCARYEVAARDLWLRDEYGTTREQIMQGTKVTIMNTLNPVAALYRRCRAAYEVWYTYAVTGGGSSRCSGLDGHGNMSPVKV